MVAIPPSPGAAHKCENLARFVLALLCIRPPMILSQPQRTPRRSPYSPALPRDVTSSNRRKPTAGHRAAMPTGSAGRSVTPPRSRSSCFDGARPGYVPAGPTVSSAFVTYHGGGGVGGSGERGGGEGGDMRGVYYGRTLSGGGGGGGMG
jgi:hypothetical protein